MEAQKPKRRLTPPSVYEAAQAMTGGMTVGSAELFCLCAPELSEVRAAEDETSSADQVLSRLVSVNPTAAIPIDTQTTSRGGDVDEEDSELTEKDSWQQMWGSSCDHPLVAAVRLHSSSCPELQEELQRFATTLGDLRNLNEAGVENLRRMIVEYDILGMNSVASTDWLVQDSTSVTGCSYGALLDEDMFQWFRTIEFTECDMVKAFACFLEVDLWRNFAEDLLSAEPLGMHTAKKDAGWRTVARTKPYNVKEDNIWIYSGFDALDKPIKSLIVFAYTPPKPKLSGVPFIPEAENGFVRSAFDCAIHIFQPMFASEGHLAPCGFRLIQLGVSRPSAAVWSDSVSTTSMQCIKDGTGDIRRFPLKFKRYVDSSPHLEARMERSPRSPLYERVKKHVEALWPCTASV